MPTKTAATIITTTETDDDIVSAREAAQRWRTWAEAMSRGGPTPPSRRILDAAILLDMKDPVASLARDAAVLREERDLEEQAARWRATVMDAHAAEGGIDAIRRRVVELRAEVKRLEALDGYQPAFMTAGSLAGKASRLRAKHPQLFPDARENRAKTTTRRDDE